MANRTINSVFQLRGDTLAQWKAKNPVLKDREVVIVVIPAGSESGLNEPAVLLKVGDGETAFNSLGYVSAIAGDVSAWAKAATKPTYDASEITGFDAAVLAAETDTQYKIEQDTNDGHVLNLFHKAKGDANWTSDGSITIPDADTGATDFEIVGDGNAVTAVSYNATTRKLTLTKGTTFAVPQDIEDAIDDLDLGNTYYGKSAGEALASAIDAIKDGTNIDSFADVESALNGIKDGTNIDSFADVESALAGKQDTIPANTYDAYGAAAAVLGDNEDDAGDPTVYGANKAAAAAQAAANAKVASVGAGDNTVTVGGTATAPTIAVKVDPAQNNAIQFGENGIKVVIPDAAVINVVKKASANAGYIASYQVTVDGTPVGVDIDIPKDYLVKSAEIKTVTTADDPYQGAVVGDKYIDFTVNTVEGSGNVSHIYLPVNDLAHVYTAGNGIEISAADVISVKIDVTNANGLSVDANGLKLALVTQSTAGAMSAADKTKLDGVSTSANKTETSTTNGNIKIDGVETQVYELPSTVLDATDTFTFDGGNA